ncbi:MAG: LuxR family transcriptional regulator [Bacteroidales bacterium]|nr:LuxR family transcriptional regulator [Candidatus Cryptobacteroides caccocaballi]
MRRSLFLISFIICFSMTAEADYVDHRGHNVDSLETVMARWTAKEFDEAGEEQMEKVAMDLEELMYGFNQTNGVKSEYYARMLLKFSRRFGWPHHEQVAAKGIGQHFWAKEQYDSAAFYYGMAMKAIEKMPISEISDGTGNRYSQKDIDNALSQMYGTLGNLYSMMDSVSVAMDYYEKAGVLFKKHGWNNSCSVLYYNMGETMREDGQLIKAEKYYMESLEYSLLAQDSLAIATSYKGLGSLYLNMHKTSKAMRYLNDANIYFADHEDEELQSRMESLDYTSQVLTLQKKRLWITISLLLALILMAMTTYYISVKLRQTAKENKELVEVLEGTMEGMGPAPTKKDIRLKPKEKEILDLIAKGYTNTQIAEAMNLSPETIKWYKKKLFTMLDASNSAELVTIAKNEGWL